MTTYKEAHLLIPRIRGFLSENGMEYLYIFRAGREDQFFVVLDDALEWVTGETLVLNSKQILERFGINILIP